MTKRPKPEDNPLWKAVIKDVKPLAHDRDHLGEPLKLSSHHNGGIKRIDRRSEKVSLSDFAGPSDKAPVQGLDRKHRRRLARGTADIDQVIDLHGLSREKAYALIAKKVPAASLAGLKTLLVITGKGGPRFAQQDDSLPVERRKRADFGLHEGVLRQALPQWLNGVALRPYVAALTEAGDAHGGAGAFYIRLKTRAR